jgi:ABC-2 type transport system permease protein
MRSSVRTLRWSAWLGWQIDSNWASPWLFALYVLLKPLAAAMLLVCMYWAAQIATGGRVPHGLLPFLYVGSAFYMLVGGVTFGMSQAVLTDREHYGMLKFIRLSPVALQTYLVGRGLSRAAQAGLGVLLALGVGMLLLGDLRAAVGAQGIAWHWLAVNLVAGLVMLMALGLMLAAAVLNLSRHATFLSEGVAGLLYLMSGVVFPINILPDWLRPLSLALPTTYWLEGMRSSLLGPSALSAPLDGWSPGQLALALLVSSAGLCVLAAVVFRLSERRAWRLGKFDEATGY